MLPITAVAVAAAAAFFVVSAGAVVGSPSGFESNDGNMTLDATPAGSTDWNCFVGSAGFQTGTPNSNCAVTSGATQTWADGGTTGVGTTELQVKPGTKFDDACTVINTGNNPPKDEWTNIAEYTEFSSSNDLYFYGASIRPTVNGNSSGNVYFSQTKNGCHTPGDVLLAFDFLNGGGTPSLHALEWLPSGSTLHCYLSSDSPPCWGNDKAINGAYYDGNVNTSQINPGDNGINGATLPANAFAEFGINLTQAIKAAGGGSLPCFANQTWISRSSGSSFSSNPEDVEVVSRPTCGSITIVKQTLNGAGTRSGINQQFSYTMTGGLTPSSFHLNDAGGATGDVACTNDSTTANPCNTETYSNVQHGSYTVTEGAEPANFGFVSVTCKNNGVTDNSGVSGQAVTIALSPQDSWVCTYVNQQQLGAIRINKTSSSATAPVALAGAKFYLCTNNTTSTSNCTAPTMANGTAVSNPLTTDANGTVCVANLPFSSNYYVFESAAPSGYGIDDTSAHQEAVNTAGDCSSSTSQSATLNATDTPLSKIYLGWHSLAGNGVTTATVKCTGEASAAAFTDGGSTPTITKTLGDGSSTLTPGTYSCTVVVSYP